MVFLSKLGQLYTHGCRPHISLITIARLNSLDWTILQVAGSKSNLKFRFAKDNFVLWHIKLSDGTLLHFVMDLCLHDKSDIVTSQKSPF